MRRLYLPTFLKYILILVLQNFLSLDAFESNKISDWLNHDASQFTESLRKDRMFLRIDGEHRPRFHLLLSMV